MSEEEFRNGENVFVHSQSNLKWLEDTEIYGVHFNATLRKHVRPDNLVTANELPLTGWVLRATDHHPDTYGRYFVFFRPTPETRILYEGTAAFRSLTKGLNRQMVRLLTAAPDIVKRALDAGYDAVEFKGSTMGIVVLNQDKFLTRTQWIAKRDQMDMHQNPWPNDHIGGHKGKPTSVDPSKFVRAHFNLNSGGHSIDKRGADGVWRHWKDEDTLALQHCYFVVQESGFRSAQASGVRNVHAWAYGVPCAAPAVTSVAALQAVGWRKATYRPVRGAQPMFSDAASGEILPDDCEVLLLSLPNTAGVRIGAKVVKKIGPMWYRTRSLESRRNPESSKSLESKRNPMDGHYVWGYPKQKAKVALTFLDSGSFSMVYASKNNKVYTRTNTKDEGKKLMWLAAAKATIGKHLLPQAELLGKAERPPYPNYDVFRMPRYEQIDDRWLRRSADTPKRLKTAQFFLAHIQPALLKHKYNYTLKEGLRFLEKQAKIDKVNKNPIFLEYYDALHALAEVMPADHSWDVEDRNMAWDGDTLILLDPVFYNRDLQWRRPSQKPPASARSPDDKPIKTVKPPQVWMSVEQAIQYAVAQALGKAPALQPPNLQHNFSMHKKLSDLQ